MLFDSLLGRLTVAAFVASNRDKIAKGDSGAKKIILARPHDVVSFDFPAGAIDIDTAADYKKLYQPLATAGTRWVSRRFR
jgi:hypothetical protein